MLSADSEGQLIMLQSYSGSFSISSVFCYFKVCDFCLSTKFIGYESKDIFPFKYRSFQIQAVTKYLLSSEGEAGQWSARKLTILLNQMDWKAGHGQD